MNFLGSLFIRKDTCNCVLLLLLINCSNFWKEGLLFVFMIVRIEVTQEYHNRCNSPGGSPSSLPKRPHMGRYIDPWAGTPPSIMVNERAVCILLECILVVYYEKTPCFPVCTFLMLKRINTNLCIHHPPFHSLFDIHMQRIPGCSHSWSFLCSFHCCPHIH